MVGLLLLGSLCFVLGLNIPLVFTSTSTTLTRALCGIGLVMWSIGCFAGGMIGMVEHFDVMRIEHIEDGKKDVRITIMCGGAVIYKKTLPERSVEAVR
jgi:hypothetical protein